MAFLDDVTITVRAGDGGDGASTFRREAHVPRGGPDGGDGGRGGSVYLRVDPGETMLRDYRYRHHFGAESGGRGTGSRRHGKAGKDLELKVPPGTLVRDVTTGDLIADLANAGKSTLLAALTAATPQIASYPFTTLEPNLGVLDLAAHDAADERRATIA